MQTFITATGLLSIVATTSYGEPIFEIISVMQAVRSSANGSIDFTPLAKNLFSDQNHTNNTFTVEFVSKLCVVT
jgi:hypothetical protein